MMAYNDAKPVGLLGHPIEFLQLGLLARVLDLERDPIERRQVPASSHASVVLGKHRLAVAHDSRVAA
jgi:hypothetical protein